MRWPERPLRPAVRHRDCRRCAFDLGAPACIIAQRFCRTGAAKKFGQAQRHSLIQRVQISKLIGIFLDQLGELPKALGTVGWRHAPPVWGFESVPGCCDGEIDISLGGQGGRADDLFGCRINQLLNAAATFAPLSSDQHRPGFFEICSYLDFGRHVVTPGRELTISVDHFMRIVNRGQIGMLIQYSKICRHYSRKRFKEGGVSNVNLVIIVVQYLNHFLDLSLRRA